MSKFAGLMSWVGRRDAPLSRAQKRKSAHGRTHPVQHTTRVTRAKTAQQIYEQCFHGCNGKRHRWSTQNLVERC